MTDRPLTDLQRRVLAAMRELEKQDRRYAYSPNEIGAQAGAKRVTASGRGNGRGSGHRVFGPAQQIIRTLTSLRDRGLIASTSRDDGLSGTAYRRTKAGREATP